MIINTDKQITLADFIEVMRSLTAPDFQIVVDEINNTLYRKQGDNGDTINVYDYSVQDIINVIDRVEENQ